MVLLFLDFFILLVFDGFNKISPVAIPGSRRTQLLCYYFYLRLVFRFTEPDKQISYKHRIRHK
jgi:hypothetical protein